MTMRLIAALLFALLPLASVQQDDPREIVRRALTANESVFDAARDYTYMRDSVTHRLDKNGAIESTDTETGEVLVLYGRPYYRQLTEDGKPLSAKDQRNEQKKLDKEVAKRKRNAERGSNDDDEDLKDRREATREIIEAYDFRLAGEESINGRPAWIIDATPRPDYKPKSRRAKLFVKTSGRLWIDRADTRLVKLEAQINETISFGWFVLRLRPGARFELEQTRLEEAVWLPRRVWVSGEGKVLGLKTVRVESETNYSEYRKFQTESRILATSAE